MRELARHWRETGVPCALRHRTGTQDTPIRTRVQGDENDRGDECTLRGATGAAAAAAATGATGATGAAG